jgi:hypothetical protein
MMDDDELSFRIVREVPGECDELLARAANLKVARAAYAAAAAEYPQDVILLKQGIRLIEQSKLSTERSPRKPRAF